MEGKELKCPCCDSVLKITHQDNYQDLSEHVSSPNRTPSLKDGYQCPNIECLANICDVAWIEDGEYFTGKRPEGLSYQALDKALKHKHGNAFAVNSWQWYYQLGKDAIKRKSFTIELNWYRFHFEPKEKGWDYPIETRHQPNLWKWKIEIWKKTSEHGYTTVIPFWRMTKHCINKFNREYKLWKENGNKSSLKECYNEATGMTSWGTVDDRFYAKITKYFLQIFKPKQVKEILLAYNSK